MLTCAFQPAESTRVRFFEQILHFQRWTCESELLLFFLLCFPFFLFQNEGSINVNILWKTPLLFPSRVTIAKLRGHAIHEPSRVAGQPSGIPGSAHHHQHRASKAPFQPPCYIRESSGRIHGSNPTPKSQWVEIERHDFRRG